MIKYWVMQERQTHGKWIPFDMTNGTIHDALKHFEQHAHEHQIENRNWRAVPCTEPTASS